ncbi:DMT family transporter [Gottfriedia acidiceleris]|uniref:DMT family transporter n=1 Tax=Bacillaceae TaxID=186817 RepID=UPI000BEC63E8|nr:MULTISPECIES: DMT family transporter [unclassified Bacillus (in: firmicutes)]PEC48601.1 EamA family transporter [Bacillus sp. AFS096315]PFM82595.1 EamA family transporter [Bacillus sp. AFS077874]
MRDLRIDRIATISLIIVTLLWGTTFVVVQNAIAYVEPFAFNAFRFILATLVLLPFLIKRKQKTKLTVKQIVITSGIGFMLFLGYLLQTFGLKYTTSSKSGFITGLCVVLVPVLLYLVYKERSNWSTVIACLIALLGLSFLTLGDSFSVNLGDVLTLIGSVAFAFHIILSGKYTKQMDPITFTTIQLATVGISSTIFSLIFEDTYVSFSKELWVNPTFLFAVIVTAVFCTSIAFWVQMFAQQHISSTKAALIFIFEPVFAAFTAVLFANETLSIQTIIGGTFIVGGMLLSEVPLPKKRTKEVKNEAI